VSVYVDDLITTGMKEAEVEAFKAQMKVTFQMNVKANRISTEDQLTDILMKSLGRVKFQALRARISLVHNKSKSAHNT
jgi:hypothetical protein